MHAQDYFILSEMEAREAQHKEADMGWQTSMRLSSLAFQPVQPPWQRAPRHHGAATCLRACWAPTTPRSAPLFFSPLVCSE